MSKDDVVNVFTIDKVKGVRRDSHPRNEMLFNIQGPMFLRVSVTNAEGPPVPIPNTEVKLCSGENTLRETVREDSSMLTQRDKDGIFRP